MNWSFKKKPQDDVVAPRAERTGLFSRRPKADAQDVEAVEVVSVMADVYPDRDPAPGELPSDITLGLDKPDGMNGDTALDEGSALSASTESLKVDTASEVSTASASVKEKKSLWKRASKAKGEAKAVKPEKATKASKAKTPQAPEDGPRPLKVLIGFLPDSSEKDTYFYMLGVAQKNLDSENIGWAGLTKFENGYAYEIHEGGQGKGYLESIINHFKSLPPFSAEETHRAFIRTATRTVRVERTPNGLYSVILPESDETPQSDWLTTGKKLAPLVEKRTGLFVMGAIIFMTSLVALMGGYATRYQPYTQSFVSLERVPVSKLPHSQWNRLTNLPPGDYVQALKFEGNEWLVQTPSNPTGKATPPAKPTASKPGASKIAATEQSASKPVTPSTPTAAAPVSGTPGTEPAPTGPTVPPVNP
jgi:hypothetical protein